MSKPRPPEIDLAVLKRFKKDPILQLAYRFSQYEEQRENGELSTAYIALEAFGSLVGGKKAGHSDTQLQKAWPKSWGNETVVVPKALVAALSELWADYKEAPPNKSLGKVFGIEGRSNAHKKQKRRDLDRKISREVDLNYLVGGLTEPPLSLDGVIKAYADKNGLGIEKVRKAYKKFAPKNRKVLRKMGILKG